MTEAAFGLYLSKYSIEPPESEGWGGNRQKRNCLTLACDFGQRALFAL